MENKLSTSVRKLGYWSGILTTLFSLLYIIGQLAEWFGWLGSAGGPESSSTSLGIIVLLIPSLLLAPSFALLMLSVHYYAPQDKKIWSHAGILFAAVYTVMVCINYYVQLTLILPHMLKNDLEPVRPFLFTPFDSFSYSIDVLGYSFMSLTTLFAAFVFAGKGLHRTIRVFMIANGLLIPFLALQIYYHPLIWFAAAWAITFPGVSISLTKLFKKGAAA